MRTEAQFSSVSPEDGHYESFFVKASEPGGGRAVWIRHTVHKRPGEEPTGAVWFTVFDRSSGPPRAAKEQFDAESVSTPRDAYIRVANSEIGPGWMRGSVSAGGLDASWNLRFMDRHETLRHLPAGWMYRSSIPRTKVLSPHPGALFDGVLEIDGEGLTIEAWPGTVGHNWGSQHAETWIWIQITDPEGTDSRDYLDIAAARVKVGPVTTPWIANGELALRGETIRIGGLRPATIVAEPSRCRFDVRAAGGRLRGTIDAPPEQFVAWAYSDPDGGGHHAINCSVCDFAFELQRRGHEETKVRLEASSVYELGTRATDHGVPLQPFADG